MPISALRAVWALLLLIRPDAAATALGAPRSGRHPVLRVLGGRELVQAIVVAAAPTRRVLALSAATDALHAASCAGLAAVSPQHRRAAVRNGIIATAAATA